MNANGLQFWMLSQAADWNLPATPSLYFSAKSKRLRLLSASSEVRPPEDPVAASTLAGLVPVALDGFDSYARWDSASGHVVAGGGGPGEVPIYAAPSTQAVTDLALGYDDVLYVAVGGSLVLIDRRNRWPNTTLSVPGFTFWRLAAVEEGGVLALDAQGRQLGRVAGAPLQTGPVDVPNPGILRSCQQNPDPPQIVARYPLPAAVTGTDVPVAFCAMGSGEYAILSWNHQAPYSFVRTFSESSGFGQAVHLAGALQPYTIGWIGAEQIAVLVTNSSEALIYDLEEGTVAISASDSYVLAGANLGPFAHTLRAPPRYPNPAWFETPPPQWMPATSYSVGESILDFNGAVQTVQAAGTSGFAAPTWNAVPRGATQEGSVTWANAGSVPPMLPLVPLSLNSFAVSGSTDPANPQTFDSGSTQTVWHRLFLEAIVPPNCGVLAWLAAADSVDGFTSWYPHVFGSADTSTIQESMLQDAPRAVWQSEACEVPFATPLLAGETVQDRQGLFMVLVQRAGTAVRSLQGRYLGVRLALNGDRRNTPEIAALRVYASRFSYVDHYLPAIYRENKFGSDADANGPSTHRDFFERFVNLFEAQLTRIEDRVASSYLLTRSESAPASALDWLGGWVGIDPNGYPPARKRARLEAIPDLYRQRGTAPGITEALDVATNGLCTRGAIIVIEDFRMRHIFATILGADLSIKDDPLLPGYSASSNSFVGDSLFLGDPGIQAELQALYATNLNIPGSQQQTEALYDRFANRITVFVHDQVESVDFALVQSVVNQEKPAHVLAVVQRASQAFMIGLASLVGVNTYLGEEPQRQTVTLDVSSIGRYDVVTHMPSLDPRLGGWQGYTEWPNPVARLQAPASVAQGATINLDASGSTASPGATLIEYQWSLLSSD